MSVDTHARRTAIQHEITAVAVRYESDVAPQSPGERHADIIAATDRLAACMHGAWMLDDDATTRALLELAGRVQVWLEHEAEVAAR